VLRHALALERQLRGEGKRVRWLVSGRKGGLKKTASEVSHWLVRGLLPANGGKS